MSDSKPVWDPLASQRPPDVEPGAEPGAARPTPSLRCESRRPPPLERGLLLWTLAAALVGATALDALWASPRRAARERASAVERATAVERMPPPCRASARPASSTPAPRTTSPTMPRKVEDIQLLRPAPAAR
ncbi:MAG: hypothetical protein KJZ91_17065 [Myxococcales bacterium]|nr:hypothetical protein [Myxococcales bacterium]